MNAIQSLYAIGMASCLFSTAVFSGASLRTGRRFSYFSWYLALESLCFLFELLMAHPATPLKALWLSGLMVTSLLIAPALWMAVRESVEPTPPEFASFGRAHRMPIVVGALLTLPLLSTCHFGVTFDDPGRDPARVLLPFIHETMLLCIGIFALQVPYYLWRCRKLLLASAAAERSRRWLQLPLLIVSTTWLSGVVRTMTVWFTDGGEQLFALLAVVDVGVTIGAAYLFVRYVAAAGPVPEPAEPKYARSQLDAAVCKRITRKLEIAFGPEQVYRDSALSLGALSERVGESEHYVSQVINQALGTSFYELVNQHRIEHAKKLLTEQPASNVLDVALAVGFNAKSTFNSAFRRHTGMTPREFRQTSS
ncbi:MAG: helix-turn-helix domain-containing protein [Steroidobacteraceae bacterium]